MSFSLLRLAQVPHNTMLNSIMASLRTMVDEDGIALWKSVERGWSKAEGVPHDESVPMIRVWVNKQKFVSPMDDQHMAITEEISEISLFCYFFCMDPTVDIQEQRTRLIAATLAQLQVPDAGGDGTDPDNYWGFPAQEIDVTHNNAFEYLDNAIPPGEGWYVSRINILTTNDFNESV